MTLAIDILSGFFLVSGAIFCVISGIGLIRMPDFYARSHAAGIGDTLGAGLILIGLMIYQGFEFGTTLELNAALIMEMR